MARTVTATDFSVRGKPVTAVVETSSAQEALDNAMARAWEETGRAEADRLQKRWLARRAFEEYSLKKAAENDDCPQAIKDYAASLKG